MRTAIITGASTGLGREFVRQLADVFPEVECYWLIARRADRLQEVADSLPEKKVECLSMDLCDPMSFMALQEKLAAEQPEIALLINNAGCGYLGNIGETDTASQIRMVDLNVRALTAVTNIVVPFMGPGGCVLNVSSIASFCPNPRMTVYSSTKAYVTSFTVGLAEELKARGITVTAVCSGPMKTEFLDLGNITGNSRTFETLPYCDQVQVAGGAWRATRAGRTIYTPRLFYKTYRVLAKVMPVKLMVKFAKT
jgi:short-subunit dehydrogenase